MYSMTGYGKGMLVEGGRELTIEVKSVNHRFLDLTIKSPKLFAPIEDSIRKELQKFLERGKVDVFITYNDLRETEKSVFVDLGMAKAYMTARAQLKDNFDLTDDFTLTNLFRLDGVVKSQGPEDETEELTKLTVKCLDIALTNLNKMRAIEGEKLKADILSRLQTLKTALETVKERAPLVADVYRDKLRQRVSEVLSGVEIDESKLINEVAFFADKSNIDEEMTRLNSHFIQCEKILAGKEAVGRKLDFLVQEFNRETNTICSKSNDLILTNTALAMKAEIEKIREQIQNLE